LSIKITDSGSEADPLSLHLNQNTPQRVINGTPIFEEALSVKENKWVYLDEV
jgi:hypothetical protein